MKLVSVAEMRAIEREADASGLTYEIMMENAGNGVANEIYNAYSHYREQSILALIGSGNNGGDALVALSSLARRGWNCIAYLVKDRDKDDPLLARLKSEGGRIIDLKDDNNFTQLHDLIREVKIVVDGIFGTGFKLPLKTELARTLTSVKNMLSSTTEKPVIIAVDCPSGVDCETGQVAPECIPANLTITMAAVKKGLFEFPAANYVGKIRVVSIGDISNLKSWQSVSCEVVAEELIAKILPERPINAHKGTFGTALIVGGSVNYTGAVLLAGEAAYRGGAGLVTLAIPSTLYLALAGQLPEATWILLPEEMGVIASHGSRIIHNALARADSLLVGPGFGLEDTSQDFLENLFDYHVPEVRKELGFVPQTDQLGHQKINFPPLVLDADGLKLISRLDKWYLKIPEKSILTPHPGEMEIISGLDMDEIQGDRLGITKECAKNWGQIVILKGAYTVIGAPDGRCAIIPIATAALATAGTGDVLAGLITGLLAQGIAPYESALAGAWIHARAGLLAAKNVGNTASIVAGDILNSIMDVMTELSQDN